MSEEKERRRLGLLPEILPAPAPPSADGPRRRTLAHMQKLLLTATTAAILEGGCKDTSPGYGVVDPMPPPAKCNPLFDADVTASLNADLITLTITAKNASSLVQGPVTVSNSKSTTIDKLDGNTRTVAFKTEGQSSWTVTLPGKCTDTAVDVSIFVMLNGTSVNASLQQPR